MSYDIDLTIDTGAESPHVIEEFNITYNVAGMLEHAATLSPYNLGWFSFRDLHNRKAGTVSAWCSFVLAELRHPDNAAELKKLEPENGWGTRSELIGFLERLEYATKRHSKTVIKVY